MEQPRWPLEHHLCQPPILSLSPRSNPISPISSTYKSLLSPPAQLCIANLPNAWSKPISTRLDTMCTLEEQVFSGCDCSYLRYRHLHLLFLHEPLRCRDFSRERLEVEGSCRPCARRKRQEELESCCVAMWWVMSQEQDFGICVDCTANRGSGPCTRWWPWRWPRVQWIGALLLLKSKKTRWIRKFYAFLPVEVEEMV